MGFRDNFKQALDEMIGNGADSAATSIDSDEFIEPAMASVLESEKKAAEQTEQAVRRSSFDYRTNFKRETVSEQPISRSAASSAKTVITSGTTIKGDLTSQGDLDIQGIIHGNVTTDGLVRVTGKIEGDVTCENLELDNAEIRGQVSVKNQLLMRGDSVLVGDLTGEQVEINGKVKGNITVALSLHLLPQAYVLGDMNTSSIQIESGAVVFGRLNITTSADPKMGFETTTSN